MKQFCIFAAGASAIALSAAGCASAPADYAGPGADPYRAALYTGAPQPDMADHYAGQIAPLQYSQTGRPFELVSYAGIAGARRAHALYTQAEAEALDGRCEARVRAVSTESLIDVADLCDVPLDMLVEFNPGVADVSYEIADATIRIPGGIEDPKGIASLSGSLVMLDAVRPGDTLEKIAYRVNASPATIASLNPGVDWSAPKAGQAYLKPAGGAVVAAAPSHNYAPPPEAPEWEGYAPAGRGGPGGGFSGAIGVRHAPYALKPVKAYGRAEGVYPEEDVSVDRAFAKIGDRVRVTAKGEKDGVVEFFYGDSPEGMRSVGTARANSDGYASKDIRVRRGTNMGGVIFGARPGNSDETKFSERVGVVKLKDEERPPREEIDED